MKKQLNACLSAAVLSCVSAVASAVEPSNIHAMEPITRGAYTFYASYLEDRVKAMNIVGPPPRPGTEEFLADERAVLMEYPPARSAQATQDTRISPDYFAGVFGAILEEELSLERTPAIYTLIARSIADFGLSTYDAKEHYQRKRPFVEYRLPTCSPYAEADLRNDGSYPSGHTAAGYGLSLVVASVAPEHREELLARGRDYAYSRVVCKVHYPSDLEAGMQVAEEVLRAQLENEQFRVDLEAAKQEWRSLAR